MSDRFLRRTADAPVVRPSYDRPVRSRSKGLAVVACGLIVAVVTAGCESSAPEQSQSARLAAQADAVATPTLRWTPCPTPRAERNECGTVEVPLDYTAPAGETIRLAILRQPARDPARRAGTLFTATGGPGGSGVEAAAAGDMLGAAIAERFDVVVVDQRGTGGSAPVRCFDDDAERERFWSTIQIPPIPAAAAETESASARLAEQCGRTAKGIAHLTTADAARDLDLVRRAAGAPQMNFLAGSYASYLGEVYAALFPGRVRALQLNAMIAPERYTRDPVADIAETAKGTEAAFTEFVRLCATAGPACAFSGGTAEQLRGRIDVMLARLRAEPIPVGPGPDPTVVRYGDAVSAMATLLYEPSRGWPALASFLVALERGADGDPAAVASPPVSAQFLESFTAITCADQVVPRTPSAWPAIADRHRSDAPTFGDLWLYMRQPCASWPSPANGYPQRYEGDWRVDLSTPALLINNRFDPVTPASSARLARDQIGDARLVIVDGYGHAPTGPCVAELRLAYLVDLKLPDEGFSCPAPVTPFTQPPR